MNEELKESKEKFESKELNGSSWGLLDLDVAQKILWSATIGSGFTLRKKPLNCFERKS